MSRSASAGVELAADTLAGERCGRCCPTNAVPWVPELFFAECGRCCADGT